MPQITIVYGLMCVVLGLVAYFGATGEHTSKTALIPTFAGIPILILGLVALRPAIRKHAMHAAAALALLLLWVPAIRGFPGMLKLMMGGDVSNPRGAVVQSIFALLCIAFVLLCVRSFVVARRAQAAMKQAG